MRTAASLTLAVFLGAATPALAAPAPQFGVLCTPTDPGLAELSGLVVGDGVMYAMADSGADERLAVLDSACAVTRWIPNPVDPYDVEDLQMFDGVLWLSDTGDNRRVRETIALTSLRPDDGSGELHRLTYPDGAHDAEALLIERDGRPVVVTKGSRGGVYVASTRIDDLPSPGPSPLTKIGEVGFGGQVTGGAVSADGTVAALRTYTDAYLYYAPDADIAKALTSGPGLRLELPTQPQGEAIAFDPAGNLVIGSESPGSVLQPLRVLPNAAARVIPESVTEPVASQGDSRKWWYRVAAATTVVVAAAAWRARRG